MPFGTPLGTKGRSASSATQATSAIAVASGSTIIVGVAWTGTATFTSLADNAGNTYTIIGADIPIDAGGTNHARQYRCQNCVGNAALVITLTLSGATTLEVLAVAIPGAAVVSVDQSNAATDAASPFGSGNITTTQAREMLVSIMFGNSGSNPATHAESTGFSIVTAAEETNGTTFWTGATGTRLVTSVGTYAASWTESGGTSAAVFIVSLKEAADGGAARGLGPSGGPRKNRLRSTRSYETSGSVGALTGTAGITFTATGTLSGAGALTGSATITFNPASTLTGSAPVTGSTSLTFSPTGTLIGIGALAGSTSLTFSPTSTITGSGALTGATTLTFAPTSTLTGAGALTGTASITFSPTGTLADATSGLTGSSSITFTVTGTLTGSGALAGVTTLTFTPTGVLTNPDQVVSQPITGGGPSYGLNALYNDFDAYRYRKRNRKELEQEIKREADEIQLELDREIAKLLLAQEAKDAERADLQRIQALADQYAGTRQEVPRNIAASLIKAQEERSRNALEQLQRELEAMFEEEELSAILILLNQ